MNLVFISNYFNHHQEPLSDAFLTTIKGQYFFLSTETMGPERKKLGWTDSVNTSYVYTADGKTEDIILQQADAIIAGSTPETLVRQAIRTNKLIFRYSERPLKAGDEPIKYPIRFVRWHYRNPRGKPIYLLCASAFTAGDYNRFGLFRNRSYKWGYFPETRRYLDLNTLFEKKEKATLLWCGRFLEWKHPDDALCIAQRLKQAGVSFTLKLIGTGPLDEALHQQAEADGLSDCVQFLGTMPPEEVRDVMEQSGIFLFTSDRQEGWGAVMNEAMNSGCAVVASDAAGSVPYLVQPGENGLVYPSGNVDALYEKAKWLLEHPDQQQKIGEAAYHTITELWNADVAAKRFLQLSQAILGGDASPDLYESGPCSRAEVIEEDWFQE